MREREREREEGGGGERRREKVCVYKNANAHSGLYKLKSVDLECQLVNSLSLSLAFLHSLLHSFVYVPLLHSVSVHFSVLYKLVIPYH